MSTIILTHSNGRFCNQLIRNIAASFIAEKHNLKIKYSIPNELSAFGLELFYGENTWDSTIELNDSNYFEILSSNNFQSNIDPNKSFFQTREIIQKIYDFIHSKKDQIISVNDFKDRYNNNNDCFVHIRLSDASQWNPGFNYYHKAIGQLKYDKLHISTDEVNHPMIRQLTKRYPANLVQMNEVDTIKFGSTCKYIVLSHGTFSSCLGYFSFFSEIYYPDFLSIVRWFGDVFSIDGWNRVFYSMFNIDDIITTDKYLEAFSKNYYKTDCIIHKFAIRWRGKKHDPPSKNQSLIISGHSDYGITNDLVEYYNPSIWWTVNKETTDSRIYSLPLGITNNTNESLLHPIYGNVDQMIEVMGQPKQDKNLVFINFNISTYPQERQHVFDLFHDKEWVTKGIIENTLEGRKRFLQDIRNHTFVLCPRGNGVDTHRLWETLYMGSIPIVRRDIAMKDFEDLPICFIDSWDEVTPEFLQKEKERIYSGCWNMEKLKLSYWIDKITLSIPS